MSEPAINPALLKVLADITSSPGFQKMAEIDSRAKDLGLKDDSTTEFVTAVCRMVLSNLDKADALKGFVDHVFQSALEAAPEIADILKKNAQVLSKLG